MLQLILLFLLLNYSHHLPWDYEREGPDTWPHTYDECEGEAQSPIDIRTSHVKYNSNLSPLSLNGYTTNISLYVWNFTHNGHTIVAYPPPLARLSMSGANLPEVFYLVQFHFHWGYNAYQGSEHTIDGIKYPLEIHFLHQAHFSTALAVLSVLFDLQRDDNPYINDLLSILNQTTNASISVEHQIDISRLFPTALSPRFYLYNGSLTTPPCTEQRPSSGQGCPVALPPCPALSCPAGQKLFFCPVLLPCRASRTGHRAGQGNMFCPGKFCTNFQSQMFFSVKLFDLVYN
jgi:carbonic anhydrase